MNESAWNEANKHFVFKKALFSALMYPTTHFDQIWNKNVQEPSL